VGKNKARVNKRKMKRLHYGDDEWPRVNRTFKTEIKPILRVIRNPRLRARTRESLQNYLVIRLVSMTDYYFTNIVRRLVDERNLDASKVLQKKSLKEEVKKGQHTAGEFLATGYQNYSNCKDVQKVLSKLLDIDFMSTIRELDRTDNYTYVKGAISLDNNWDEFRRMFDLRDDIAHQMEDSKLSTTQVLSLADNTMNFLDAASWICHPEFFNYESNRIVR
jgi:hypothetical protein